MRVYSIAFLAIRLTISLPFRQQAGLRTTVESDIRSVSDAENLMEPFNRLLNSASTKPQNPYDVN